MKDVAGKAEDVESAGEQSDTCCTKRSKVTAEDVAEYDLCGLGL